MIMDVKFEENSCDVKVDFEENTCNINLNFGEGVNITQQNGIPIPEKAEVGQTIVVKSVDEKGKPDAWEAVDMPNLDEAVKSVNGTMPDENGNVQLVTGEGTIKFKETERGKTVFHAVITVEPMAYGVYKINYLVQDVCEQIVAEAIDQYEVTVIHTLDDGTVNTYSGAIGEDINNLFVELQDDRTVTLRHGVNNTIYNTGTAEITVKSASDADTLMSPHKYYVGKKEIVSDVDWETTLDASTKALIPDVEAVQEGLQIFGQTYTAYVENVSTEPIEITLQNRTYYYFGSTPKITFDRSVVSRSGSYCCFVFNSGETPTELLDSIKKSSAGYTSSYGWPSWRVPQDTIKPNTTYRCVIHHGIPFLEEYSYNDTNAMSDLLGNIYKYKLCSNASVYWVPTHLSEVEEAYNKYSYLDGRIGIDKAEFQQAYSELKAADDAVVARSGVCPALPFTLSAYTAVGGEKYYMTAKSTSGTATAGAHLIKLTIPAFPEGYADSYLSTSKVYICVKNGTVTSLTTSNDTYAINLTAGIPTEERVFYFKPGTDTTNVTFNTELVFVTYSFSSSKGSYTSSGTQKVNGTTQKVTYNSLLEAASVAETTEE